MERLAEHPLSYEAKDFIMKYRNEFQNITDAVKLLPVNIYIDNIY